MKPLTIIPNRPTIVELIDPEGSFDFDSGIGRYMTPAGEVLTLPRPAVVQLNALDLRPGEPVRILKRWTGRTQDRPEWEISRPKPQEAQEAPAAATQPEPPVPIQRASRPPQSSNQTRLFDLRGTGTDGPSPAPAPLAIARPRKVGPIPANIAVREILEFINADPGARNWGDQARQDLASTILIAAFRAKYIGLWERKP